MQQMYSVTQPPNVENKAPWLLAALYGLLAVVVLSTSARIYSRCKHMRGLGADDWTALPAAVCFSAFSC